MRLQYDTSILINSLLSFRASLYKRSIIEKECRHGISKDLHYRSIYNKQIPHEAAV
jgi:hypothetical protein